jgi:hypothetical protein
MTVSSAEGRAGMKNVLSLSIICVVVVLFVGCRAGADSGFLQDPRQASSHKTVQVDWRAKLESLQKQLAKEPNSAFLHSQAAMAYEGLGDFQNFDREINVAINLDRERATYCYFAFAVYKQHHLLDKEIAILEPRHTN